MSFVLDASATLALLFVDERSPFTEALMKALAADRLAYVPSIWTLEVLNGLLVAERRKRCSPDEVARVLQIIDALPIEQVGTGLPGACALELGFARQLKLSAYDAAYLALAHRRALPLATADLRLRKAAAEAGVEVFR